MLFEGVPQSAPARTPTGLLAAAQRSVKGLVAAPPAATPRAAQLHAQLHVRRAAIDGRAAGETSAYEASGLAARSRLDRWRLARNRWQLGLMLLVNPVLRQYRGGWPGSAARAAYRGDSHSSRSSCSSPAPPGKQSRLLPSVLAGVRSPRLGSVRRMVGRRASLGAATTSPSERRIETPRAPDAVRIETDSQHHAGCAPPSC